MEKRLEMEILDKKHMMRLLILVVAGIHPTIIKRENGLLIFLDARMFTIEYLEEEDDDKQLHI